MNTNPSFHSSKSTNWKSLFDQVDLPYNQSYNNCKNTLCFTYSKNYIYKPHTGSGTIGTTAAGYLAQRKRL